jgi:3-oxoadipate enol-lactonase
MLTYIGANTTTKSTSHALLFLHAFPLSASMWQSQIEALGKTGFTVIAPNAFGIEGSEEKESWTFTEYAHELSKLLESLGVEKVTIVGLSMGGYQAFEFYRLYPDKTASLVLCDTRAESDAPEALNTREEFIQAVGTAGADEAVRRMIPNYFTAATYTKRPELVVEAENMIRKQPIKVIIGAMRAIMMRLDASPLLSTIHCPVLVINGAEDKLTTPETAKSINARIPGSQFQLIANAGHISNMEQPEDFNRALLDHIEKV